MGEDTGHWHMAFFVLRHYASWLTMIYITNANARINIVSITAGSRNIGYLLLTNNRTVLQRSQDPMGTMGAD